LPFSLLSFYVFEETTIKPLEAVRKAFVGQSLAEIEELPPNLAPLG
jgi:hypothetical protein